MSTYLRVYDGSLTPLGILTDFKDLNAQLAFCQPGTLSASYPSSGKNAHLLDLPFAWLSVIEDGRQWPQWFVLEDDGDENDKNPNRPIKITCRDLLSTLEWAIVYPDGNPDNTDPTPSGGTPDTTDVIASFKKCTPGRIMRELFDRAQARGALLHLNRTWSDLLDTNGREWPSEESINFQAGTDYLSVLRTMVENEWLTATTDGWDLNLYAKGGHLEEDRPQVVYRLGKDATTSTRSRSRRTIRNVMLGMGQDNVGSPGTELEFAL